MFYFRKILEIYLYSFFNKNFVYWFPLIRIIKILILIKKISQARKTITKSRSFKKESKFEFEIKKGDNDIY